MDYCCEKCKRILDENKFYYSNNTQKYPNGKLNICKECITSHVNNYEPDTYIWILRECDVCYYPYEWSRILKFCSENKERKITGMTIMGRYLSTMKLKSYEAFRWKDTQFTLEVYSDYMLRNWEDL